MTPEELVIEFHKMTQEQQNEVRYTLFLPATETFHEFVERVKKDAKEGRLDWLKEELMP